MLSIFDNSRQDDLDRGTNKRQMSKAYEFMKNEAIFAESHKGSGLDDQRTMSNIMKLR